MDYEKKYKEALERAKDLISRCKSNRDRRTMIYRVEDIEHIFPELKESKDEKVRKALIALLKFGLEDDSAIAPGFNETKEQALAWLEKQGKSNPYSGVGFDCYGHHWGMCARDNGVEIIFDGELKAFLSSEKSFLYPIHHQSYLKPKSAFKGLQEEKVDNANKFEPKFKVGDWVVVTVEDLSATLQIANVDMNKELYWFDDDLLYLPFADEECLRLWTIEDAKAGDVLYYSDDIIVIFKYFHDDSSFCSYCYIDGGVFYTSNDRTPVWWVNNVFYPATEEQRDILFAKMKEAGYLWDADKKELVEQMTDEEHKQCMLEHQDETIYDMSFEEAQDFISKRGFDIPWNDGDVMVDERKLTQTVANVLKWADRHPLILPDKKK
jgi:hypothetical protein